MGFFSLTENYRSRKHRNVWACRHASMLWPALVVHGDLTESRCQGLTATGGGSATAVSTCGILLRSIWLAL